MRIEAEHIKIGMKIRATPFKCDGALMDYVRSLSKGRPKHYKLKQVKCNDSSYYKSYSKRVS
jgi:hypothetical protein